MVAHLRKLRKWIYRYLYTTSYDRSAVMAHRRVLSRLQSPLVLKYSFGGPDCADPARLSGCRGGDSAISLPGFMFLDSGSLSMLI